MSTKLQFSDIGRTAMLKKLKGLKLSSNLAVLPTKTYDNLFRRTLSGLAEFSRKSHGSWIKICKRK